MTLSLTSLTPYSLLILTESPILSKSWKEWLLTRTSIYQITQIIRDAYLLSNSMRRDLTLNIYFQTQTEENDGNENLYVTFNPQKLRYLAPDSRSIFFLLFNSIKRYYSRKTKTGSRRSRKPLPGIYVQPKSLPSEIQTDLLLIRSQDPISLHRAIPAPALGRKITIDLRSQPNDPIINSKYHVQWNPIWQFLTLYLNHPQAESYESHK